jgi:tetratricopeptide (TPR) repeat protein
MPRRMLVAVALVAVVGCSETPSAPAGAGGVAASSPAAAAAAGERKTTDGAIAVGNLDAQITGTERLAKSRALSVKERASQVDLLMQRGQVLGHVHDYEAAEAMADALVAEAPNDPIARLARARSRATWHRFTDALADAAEAARLGALPGAVDAVRAGILQATGNEEAALTIRHQLAEARPDITTLGGEATVRAARGELDEAERLFDAAIASYRDVSPFPVAWIEFQRGLMWMREDQLPRARALLAAAHRRLPQHVQAQGHLAEVEAALGHTDEAVALLKPLADASEDPDYAAQLARILTEAGHGEEAKAYRARAAARYDELMAKHPEAYADHAAEFWLAAGADPARALGYAEKNLALRPTVRAWELVLRAAKAKGDGDRACAAANGAREAGYLYASARTVVDETLARCPGCAE